MVHKNRKLYRKMCFDIQFQSSFLDLPFLLSVLFLKRNWNSNSKPFSFVASKCIFRAPSHPHCLTDACDSAQQLYRLLVLISQEAMENKNLSSFPPPLLHTAFTLHTGDPSIKEILSYKWAAYEFCIRIFTTQYWAGYSYHWLQLWCF